MSTKIKTKYNEYRIVSCKNDNKIIKYLKIKRIRYLY
jgi:hypothetical protein